MSFVKPCEDIFIVNNCLTAAVLQLGGEAAFFGVARERRGELMDISYAQNPEGCYLAQTPALRALYAALMDSGAFRIMLGRLAMRFDGGQILD